MYYFRNRSAIPYLIPLPDGKDKEERKPVESGKI